MENELFLGLLWQFLNVLISVCPFLPIGNGQLQKSKTFHCCEGQRLVAGCGSQIRLPSVT